MRFVGMIAAALIALLPFGLQAQTAHASEHGHALRVQGLTSAERDELQQELKDRDDLKLVYTCVPAGVLVFEAANGGSKQRAVQLSTRLLEARSLRTRTEELTGGLASAEAACEKARDRQP